MTAPPPVARPLGSVYNEVPKFIQRYVYRGKKVEGIVKTRMKQYNKTKTQTIQLILLDPNSLTQRSFGSLPIEKAVVLLYSFLFSLVKKTQMDGVLEKHFRPAIKSFSSPKCLKSFDF